MRIRYPICVTASFKQGIMTMSTSKSSGRKTNTLRNSARSTAWKLAAAVAAVLASAEAGAAITCARTLTADVIAFDQPIMFNRLGAANVNGMMYASRARTRAIASYWPLQSTA